MPISVHIYARRPPAFSVTILIFCGLFLFRAAVLADESGQDSVSTSAPIVIDYFEQNPPGDEPVIFAPGTVSTDKMEYRFVVSATGQDMFFAREGTIYQLKKNENGAWDGPVLAPFSGDQINGESCFSSDGKRIYFCSRRPCPGAKEALNVWVSDKVDGRWTAPYHLGAPVTDQTVHGVSVAANGNLYGSGIIRLRFVDGKYQAAEELAPPIIGYHPYVAPDESFILFGRRRPGENPGDLFITFQRADGTWTDPTGLGEKINTAGKETNASLSPDGKYLFFSRNEDIYWVKSDFIDEIKKAVELK